MKKTFLSLLVFGTVLSAAPVNVAFLNAGSPAVSYNGEYVGPYTLNVNGITMAAMFGSGMLVAGFSTRMRRRRSGGDA
jgi:hypothetical protein